MKIQTIPLLNSEWEYKERENSLLVGRRKVGKGWHNAKDFLLPKELELDENVAEGIGLYLGDGKLTDNDLGHAQFHNKDFDLIKKIFTFFRKLGAKESDMTFTLSYRGGRINEELKEFKLLIKSKKIRIVKTDRNRFPAYSIQINGKIFRIFLKNFIMECLNFIKTDTELRKGFLCGYFAAEGWIGYSKKENYIVNIGFAYNPKTEEWLRDFCIECLKLEGINSKINIRHEEHNGQIIMTNWENYYKLWKLGIFEGCQRKKNKFTKIFMDMKICCEINEFMRLRLFSGNQYEIAKNLGTYQATISNMKSGSKRNMWPTIEHIKKLSEINEIPLDEIEQNISRIRFGNSTILSASQELIKDVFNRENLLS